MTKIVEMTRKMRGNKEKVIHIEKNDFIGKIELYTELFTLSTENSTNYAVYIVKKSNSSFVQIR